MRKKTSSQVQIAELKEKLGLEHSEQLFGIIPEIPLQCPRINGFQDDIDLIRKHFSRLQELIKDKECRDLNEIFISREIKVIDEYISSLDESYEQLRSACEDLRARGTGWKQLARNMFPSVPDNKFYIEEKFKNQI